MSEEGNSITYQINVITITKCALYKWLNWSYYIYITRNGKKGKEPESETQKGSLN